jgi:hypothetical protein
MATGLAATKTLDALAFQALENLPDEVDADTWAGLLQIRDAEIPGLPINCRFQQGWGTVSVRSLPHQFHKMLPVAVVLKNVMPPHTPGCNVIPPATHIAPQMPCQSVVQPRCLILSVEGASIPLPGEPPQLCRTWVCDSTDHVPTKLLVAKPAAGGWWKAQRTARWAVTFAAGTRDWVLAKSGSGVSPLHSQIAEPGRLCHHQAPRR